MEKILIIEDEENIRSFIKLNLQRKGYSVYEAETGEDGLSIIQEEQDIAILILDIMLPGIDGFEVAKEVRTFNKQVGIIMLTAKTMEADKVTGLVNGADDYMSKPFSVNELIARVQSLLRRIQPLIHSKQIGLKLDRSKRCLINDGEPIELSPTEYQILSILDLAKGKAVSRNDVLDEVWGLDFPGDPKVVDVNIRRIRQKVEADPSHPVHIQTVWGYGYKWEKI
ncbi:response regulator transcription factor [Ornithinibacillus gellani]|uniref:response regulator transcription factor n=1 Tax=Ornithinibacillus gellani TaxID=2293253 RepID=UPI000F46192A|nr:response regulator transcription factor [Ornithinibacillus gellani]TQS75394.1 response regulator transcription factor [Ornithinibacillus gellani]